MSKLSLVQGEKRPPTGWEVTLAACTPLCPNTACRFLLSPSPLEIRFLEGAVPWVPRFLAFPPTETVFLEASAFSESDGLTSCLDLLVLLQSVEGRGEGGLFGGAAVLKTKQGKEDER